MRNCACVVCYALATLGHPMKFRPRPDRPWQGETGKRFKVRLDVWFREHDLKLGRMLDQLSATEEEMLLLEFRRGAAFISRHRRIRPAGG